MQSASQVNTDRNWKLALSVAKMLSRNQSFIPKIKTGAAVNMIEVGQFLAYSNHNTSQKSLLEPYMALSPKTKGQYFSGMLFGVASFLQSRPPKLCQVGDQVEKEHLSLLARLEELNKSLDEISFKEIDSNPNIRGYITARKRLVVTLEETGYNKSLKLTLTLRNKFFSLISPREEVKTFKENSKDCCHSEVSVTLYYHLGG